MPFATDNLGIVQKSFTFFWFGTSLCFFVEMILRPKYLSIVCGLLVNECRILAIKAAHIVLQLHTLQFYFYFQFLEVEISTILLLEFLFYHYYSCDSSFDFWPQIVSFFFFCKITLRILNSKFNITVNIVLIFFLLEVWPPNYYLGLAKSYTEIKKFNHKRCISCRVIDLYHLKATKRSVHQ